MSIFSSFFLTKILLSLGNISYWRNQMLIPSLALFLSTYLERYTWYTFNTSLRPTYTTDRRPTYRNSKEKIVYLECLVDILLPEEGIILEEVKQALAFLCIVPHQTFDVLYQLLDFLIYSDVILICALKEQMKCHVNTIIEQLLHCSAPSVRCAPPTAGLLHLQNIDLTGALILMVKVVIPWPQLSQLLRGCHRCNLMLRKL